MRYLINMDYSFDLNINTMGRRIRTRLYFTSESHLHTVLNVLRFAACNQCTKVKTLLSEHGMSVINEAPELCYLTQLVMRVFEDGRRPMDDPRRFRVELLFSPGATATPFHMDELTRQSDSSRFDTAPLQNIGRDDLTCQDVEDFFESVIFEGRGSDDSYDDAFSTSTAAEGGGRKEKDKEKKKDKDKKPKESSKSVPSSLSMPLSRKMSPVKEQPETPDLETAESTEESPPPAPVDPGTPTRDNTTPREGVKPLPPLPEPAEGELEYSAHACETNGDGPNPTEDVPIDEPTEDVADCDLELAPSREEEEDVKRIIARKYFWSTVAIGSLALGLGCLVMALRLSDEARHRRKWSKSY